MKILNLIVFSVSLLFSGQGYGSKGEVLKDDQNTLQAVLMRLNKVEKENTHLREKIEKQEITLIQQKEAIENLQQFQGLINVNPPAYRKIIPADAGAWIALGWSLITVILKTDENYFTLGTLFLTTFITMYWVFKEVRNQALIPIRVLNRH